MGLRWAAADDTIAGVAAMGPCTDWRPTRWWSAVATDAAVAALAIDTWAPQLANRPVYIAIGNTMMACTHQAPSSSPQPSWREKATSPPRAPPDWSCTWLRPRGTLSQRNFVELAQRGFCDRSRRRQRQRDYRHAHRTTLYCWHTTHNSNVVAYIRVFILNCMHHHYTGQRLSTTLLPSHVPLDIVDSHSHPKSRCTA